MGKEGLGYSPKIDGITHFLTLPQEEILLVIRPHFLTILPDLIITALLTILLFLSTILFFNFLMFHTILFALTLSVILISICSFLLWTIVNWYYHLYLITNKKIMNIYFAPLKSHCINTVLLDQIITTEVDIDINGAIGELFNVGNIKIRFGQPFQEELFTLENIQNPRRIGVYLSETFEEILTITNLPKYSLPGKPKILSPHNGQHTIFNHFQRFANI
ncbi:hypothetical protein HYW54_01935 [Candidatus Gottesmanbacteria bacterium]|nr:hypothetical protein [Candidatus Gottesmanbacteria bacterium]